MLANILLREQELVNPVVATLGQDDAAVTVLVEPLLEHAAAQIVGLPGPDLFDSGAKRYIVDQRLACRLRKPPGFEGSL